MMKTRNILGKQVPVLFIAILLFTGVGSAALLEYFGQVESTVTVSQAITVTGDLTTTIPDAVGSETYYSDEAVIESNTVNDLDVKFVNECDPDCEGINTTNRVELSVSGFGTEDAFLPSHYKKTYYEAAMDLANLVTVDYSFKITVNTFGSDTLAPYVVVVSDDFPYGAAVYIIGDGSAYDIGTEYTGTVDGNSKFHVPGDTNGCADQNYVTGCTLDEIKAFYPSATITKISYALGAWPGETDKTISASIGLSEINSQQALHKYVTVYGNSNIPTIQKYDFAPDITPGTYTITTTIDLVE